MSIQNIVFLAKNNSEFSKLMSIFGFEECLHKTDSTIRLYRQHNLLISVKGAVTPFEKELVTRHGSFIQEAWFLSTVSKIVAIDGLGVTLRCITSQEKKAFEEDFLSPNVRRTPSLLSHLDHIAVNIESSSLDRISKDLLINFDFFPIESKYIQGLKTSFTCSSFQFRGEDTFLVLNTSDDPASQIQSFINRHQGPGVQHLAFHTNSLQRVIPIFKKQGVPFIDIPDAYYRELKATGIPEKEYLALQKASLLLEKSSFRDGHLKQTFTKDLIGPIFFEFISRENINGFGEKNITALFKAVESI